MTPASGSDLAMTRSGNRTPRPVPRLLGWTTTVERRNDRSEGSHQRRWASVTTVTILSRGTNLKARCNDNCNSDGPPLRDQNCFGVETPLALVVNEPSRRPSPPARITTQQVRVGLITVVRCSVSASENPSKGEGAYTPDGQANIPVARYCDYRISGNRRRGWRRVRSCSNIYSVVAGHRGILCSGAELDAAVG
jgi:hypothetical protein